MIRSVDVGIIGGGPGGTQVAARRRPSPLAALPSPSFPSVPRASHSTFFCSAPPSLFIVVMSRRLTSGLPSSCCFFHQAFHPPRYMCITAQNIGLAAAHQIKKVLPNARVAVLEASPNRKPRHSLSLAPAVTDIIDPDLWPKVSAKSRIRLSARTMSQSRHLKTKTVIFHHETTSRVTSPLLHYYSPPPHTAGGGPPGVRAAPHHTRPPLQDARAGRGPRGGGGGAAPLGHAAGE
jgi:hypothetical protein